MKAYLITTGVIFGLITLAHFWRMYAEPAAHATDPFFIGLTVLTLGLCAWSVHLLRRAAQGPVKAWPPG